MQCRHTGTTRKSLLDRELGIAPPVTLARLASHLETCPDCVELARGERTLSRDLSGLRLEIPFEVDVTARVLHEVRTSSAAPREVVSPVSLGWASAVAAAAGVALAVALWQMLPGLTPLVSAGADLLAPVGGAIVKLAGAALDVLSVPLKMLWSLAGKLWTLTGRLASWEPLFTLAVGLGYGLMAVIIALFVGRDIKQTRAA